MDNPADEEALTLEAQTLNANGVEVLKRSSVPFEARFTSIKTYFGRLKLAQESPTYVHFMRTSFAGRPTINVRIPLPADDGAAQVDFPAHYFSRIQLSSTADPSGTFNFICVLNEDGLALMETSSQNSYSKAVKLHEKKAILPPIYLNMRCDADEFWFLINKEETPAVKCSKKIGIFRKLFGDEIKLELDGMNMQWSCQPLSMVRDLAGLVHSLEHEQGMGRGQRKARRRYGAQDGEDAGGEEGEEDSEVEGGEEDNGEPSTSLQALLQSMFGNIAPPAPKKKRLENVEEEEDQAAMFPDDIGLDAIAFLREQLAKGPSTSQQNEPNISPAPRDTPSAEPAQPVEEVMDVQEPNPVHFDQRVQKDVFDFSKWRDELSSPDTGDIDPKALCVIYEERMKVLRALIDKDGATDKEGAVREERAVHEEGAALEEGASHQEGAPHEEGAAHQKRAAHQEREAHEEGAARQEGAAHKEGTARQERATQLEGAAQEEGAAQLEGAQKDPNPQKDPSPRVSLNPQQDRVQYCTKDSQTDMLSCLEETEETDTVERGVQTSLETSSRDAAVQTYCTAPETCSIDTAVQTSSTAPETLDRGVQTRKRSPIHPGLW